MNRLALVLALLLVPTTASGDARSDLEVAFAAGLDVHPELFAAVATAEPKLTRAGTLRFFGDPVVLDPDATLAIAHRLVHGDDSDAVRRALAERLLRVDSTWDAVRLDLLSSDRSDGVRAMIAAGLRGAEPEMARRGLEIALTDSASQVRREAAAVISRRPDAVELAPLLLPALTDSVADVRLQAVRSLDAIAPELALAAPRFESLLFDSDPRVAKAALRLKE
jgi:HEAT repeat protein